MKLAKGTILSDNDILIISNACYNKIESEIYPTKHKEPVNILIKTLDMFGFNSLYQFTQFLIIKYDIDIRLDDMFIEQYLTYKAYVIKPDKRETMLSFYKQIIRDIKLDQII